MRFNVGTAIFAATANARITRRVALAITAEALEITKLFLTDSQPGNTTLQFDVYNPDPLSLAKTTCSGSWPHSGAFPAEYILCRDSSFTWRLDDYAGINSFTIGLTHAFKDPSIGVPPYDRLRAFAGAALNDTVLSVSKNGTIARQRIDTALVAPIYALVA